MNQDKIPSYIAVEGPIGVGKTSLARKISADFGHQLCLEQPDENPFLKDFYENKQKFAFAAQIHFVMQRYVSAICCLAYMICCFASVGRSPGGAGAQQFCNSEYPIQLLLLLLHGSDLTNILLTLVTMLMTTI